MVAEEGYIPLDGVEAYAGDAPAGKVVVGGSSSVSPVMEKLIEAYAKVNPEARDRASDYRFYHRYGKCYRRIL